MGRNIRVNLVHEIQTSCRCFLRKHIQHFLNTGAQVKIFDFHFHLTRFYFREIEDVINYRQ